jgi:phenylalanyl-tRNA synthetase beta chain
VYEGKNLEDGKKSYAVSFVLQDETQTLTEAVIDKVMTKLVKNLDDTLGAKQR